MKRLEQLLAALTPKRWPVRWRLAAVSAGLTFLILVIFALVVGRLTSNRLEDNFNDELRDAATQTVRQLQLQGCLPQGSDQMVAGAAARVVDSSGTPFPCAAFDSSPNLGAPPQSNPAFTDVGSLRVYTLSVPAVRNGTFIPAFLQYARSTDNLDSTLSRLW